MPPIRVQFEGIGTDPLSADRTQLVTAPSVEGGVAAGPEVLSDLYEGPYIFVYMYTNIYVCVCVCVYV